ncbi:MAG: hypothetical protein V7698_13400 [Paracoccaceae bacterium]
MISENAPSRHITGTTSSAETAESSYVDWAAILAGGIFALAISFLLVSFGASLGLSLASPFRGEGVSAAWLVIAAGIWLAWVMVVGFGAGGYLCGRLRRRAGDATPHEVEARDGMHGLLVWATGAMVGTVLAAFGAGGFISAGVSAADTVTELAGDAVSSDYFANVMLRGDAGATTGEGADAISVAPAVQQEVATIITRSLTTGEMVERDRTYMAQVVAANSDLGQDEARARVDETIAEIDAARAAAREVAEKARVAGVIFGFIAAATLLIGAVAAFFAAAAGGHHRDQGLGFDIFTARR